MTPQEYIKQELESGRLTLAHVEALTRHFQYCQRLAGDGMPGPLTRERLAEYAPALFPRPAPKLEDIGPFLCCPLPYLPARGTPQARKPVITSGFRTADRKDHNGVDIFYRWLPGDKPYFVGDGGCEGKNADGTPKWVVPYGTYALAAADGTVQIAGPSPTGFRVWIDHGNGLRSGYFHLATAPELRAGMKVSKGFALGLVGHNPTGGADGNHLHFEVSPVEKYQPMDPQKYLLPW